MIKRIKQTYAKSPASAGLNFHNLQKAWTSGGPNDRPSTIRHGAHVPSDRGSIPSLGAEAQPSDHRRQHKCRRGLPTLHRSIRAGDSEPWDVQPDATKV